METNVTDEDLELNYLDSDDLINELISMYQGNTEFNASNNCDLLAILMQKSLENSSKMEFFLSVINNFTSHELEQLLTR